MPKLSVTEFLSLDGVMQGPGDPDEDRSGGFAHGGWHRPYVDDVFMKAASEGMAETGGFLFGRKTYEIMAAFDPDWNGGVPYSMVIAPGGQVLYKAAGPIDILEARRAILASFPDDDYVGQHAYWNAR